MGSFQTITFHGRSGLTTWLRSGSSTSTGAADGISSRGPVEDGQGDGRGGGVRRGGRLDPGPEAHVEA